MNQDETQKLKPTSEDLRCDSTVETKTKCNMPLRGLEPKPDPRSHAKVETEIIFKESLKGETKL